MPRSGCAHVPAGRRLGVIALAALAAALLTACGGSGSRHAAAAVKVTPARLLDETAGAARTLDSGHLDLHVDLALRGVRRLGRAPITLDLSGPFARDRRGRVSIALAITLTAAQANVSAALDVVDGVAYLGLGGEFYKLGRAHGRSEGVTGVTGTTGPISGPTGPLAALGLDPASWLVAPRIVGTADVGGVTTQHLHAGVDVAKALDDLYAALEPALGASGTTGAPGDTGASGSSGATGSRLDEARALLEAAITAAGVDLYTGVSDHLLRRAQLALSFTAPAAAAGLLGGLRGGSLDLDLTLTGLGKPQSIPAPARVQPASKLFNGVLALESQFGSLAPLVKPFGAMLPSALGLQTTPAAAGG